MGYQGDVISRVFESCRGNLAKNNIRYRIGKVPVKLILNLFGFDLGETVSPKVCQLLKRQVEENIPVLEAGERELTEVKLF